MRIRPSLLALAAAGSLLGAAVAAGASPSPSLEPGASMRPVTPASPSMVGSIGSVGAIDWVRSTKGKGFAGDAHVADVVQATAGQVFLCGSAIQRLGPPVAALWSSKNGVKWSSVTWKASPGSQCFGLVAWSGGLVAVGGGDSGHLWTSTNGRKWRVAGIDGAASLNDIAVTAGGLAIVGDVGAAPETAPTLWLSPDGSAWEAHPIAAQGSARHLALAPDGAFVVAGKVPGAAGGLPMVWRSSDGVVWEPQPLSGVADGRWFIPAFKATPAGLVLTLTGFDENQVASSGVWTSPDGTAWAQTIPTTSGSFSAAGPLGQDAMVIGPGGTWRSSDGITWVAHPEATFEGYDILAGFIPLASGQWLAAGDTFEQPSPGIATWLGTATVP